MALQPTERLIVVAETGRQVGLAAAAAPGDEPSAQLARRHGEERDAGLLGGAPQVVEMVVGLGHLPAGVGKDGGAERVDQPGARHEQQGARTHAVPGPQDPHPRPHAATFSEVPLARSGPR
ncbi:MAG: hypothetical protein M0Z42_14440 [Actinomycetota bacterium]|nr:hypothetical protein [Actinomycetota bacterium]